MKKLALLQCDFADLRLPFDRSWSRHPWYVSGVGTACRADVLLDDKFADGSRAESKRPAEAAVWVGREADVTVAEGALTTKMGASSQKIWTYFTDTEPVTLAVGQKLTASISFIPRNVLAESTSRSFRIGLFHDRHQSARRRRCEQRRRRPRCPVDRRPGLRGPGAGHRRRILRHQPFDLGKRTNLASPSLLGTSGDYTKMSGGTPVALALDKEYRLTFEIAKVSDKQVDLTVSLYQGDEAAVNLQRQRRRLLARRRTDLRQVRPALHPHRRQRDDGRPDRLHELQSRANRCTRQPPTPNGEQALEQQR